MKLFMMSMFQKAALETPTLVASYGNGSLPYRSKTVKILYSGPLQSNGVSRNNFADTLDEAPHLPYDGWIKGAYYYNLAQNQLLPFTTSHNQYLPDVLGDYGAIYQIVKRLLDARVCDRVDVYKYGKGGSAFGSVGFGDGRWAVPSGELTAGLSNLITTSGVSKFDWIINFHGETDSLDIANANNYLANMNSLRTHLEGLVTIDNWLVFSLEPLPDFSGPGQPIVRQAQVDFCNQHSNAYLSENDISGETFEDGSHYDLDQLVVRANTAADIMIPIIQSS